MKELSAVGFQLSAGQVGSEHREGGGRHGRVRDQYCWKSFPQGVSSALSTLLFPTQGYQ